MSYNIRTIDSRVVQQSIGRFIATWLLFGIGSTIGLASVMVSIKISGVYSGTIDILGWAPWVGLFFVLGAWLPALLIFPAVDLWGRIPGKGRCKYALSAIMTFIVLIPLLSIGLYICGIVTPIPQDTWKFAVIDSIVVLVSVWFPALLFPKLVDQME